MRMFYTNIIFTHKHVFLKYLSQFHRPVNLAAVTYAWGATTRRNLDRTLTFIILYQDSIPCES